MTKNKMAVFYLVSLVIGFATLISGYFAVRNPASVSSQKRFFLESISRHDKPMALVDQHGVFRAWNTAAEVELRYSKDRVLGGGMHLMIPSREDIERDCPQYLTSRGDYNQDSVTRDHHEAVGVFLEGDRHSTETVQPIRRGDGTAGIYTLKIDKVGDALAVVFEATDAGIKKK